MFKKMSLELGGKNPNIVFEDADLDNAVNMATKAAFSNQGQICLCGSRLFVQESIYNDFRSAIIEETKTLQVGDPQDEKSNLGAVVSKEHMDKILSCIEQAKGEGGEILTGGNRLLFDPTGGVVERHREALHHFTDFILADDQRWREGDAVTREGRADDQAMLLSAHAEKILHFKSGIEGAFAWLVSD